MQTLQNEDAFFTLQKADSILGSGNNSSDKKTIERQDKINDTTLSLVERLASENKNTKEMSFEEYKKVHPLSGILFPFVIETENGEAALAHSSFIGYSTIEDTIKVNKYLTSGEIISLFPSSTKFLWSKSMYLGNSYNLTAITDSCKTIYFTNPDIENLTIKEKDEPFKIIKSVFGSKKYILKVKFKRNAINKIIEFTDYKSSHSENKPTHLLTMQISGNKYRNSVTADDFTNEILLTDDLNQADVDSIKVNYTELVKDE